MMKNNINSIHVWGLYKIAGKKLGYFTHTFTYTIHCNPREYEIEKNIDYLYYYI